MNEQNEKTETMSSFDGFKDIQESEMFCVDGGVWNPGGVIPTGTGAGGGFGAVNWHSMS
ncbi:MAG: hypothetical protein FWC13_12910 [Oscillospiraceae bacterium]|nr:hypothetical protein [Oscillospiraceae bacterium]